jgi:chemotaxis protein CheZ
MHDRCLTCPSVKGEILGERLHEIRSRYPESSPEMVAEVVRAVLTSMSGDLTAQETSLLAEVEALGRTIATAKSEIAALRMDDITASHIPFATDELDAIVQHTASATHAILASCETLDAVAGGLSGELAPKLQDATTQIYEACSFQDITGQRITKVVNTLKAIEAKVEQIVSTFGPSDGERVAAESSPAGELLNGPQLPTAAMDQSDIDKLLASFE